MVEGQEPQAPPPDRSRRAVILATVGIVVILGLALLMGCMVVPLWQTHRIVRACATLEVKRDEGVARLGGPERALERLLTYRRLPRWIKPDRANATFLLGWCGPPAVPALIKALDDTDANVREAAAGVLRWIGPEAKKAVPALIKVLGDAEAPVRKAAVWTLSFIGPAAKKAVPTLVKVLDDTDADVRWGAVEALGRIGPEAREAVPALIKVLSSAEWELRCEAADALGQIDTEAGIAVIELEKLLTDIDPSVRKAAAEALKKICGEE